MTQLEIIRTEHDATNGEVEFRAHYTRIIKNISCMKLVINLKMTAGFMRGTCQRINSRPIKSAAMIYAPAVVIKNTKNAVVISHKNKLEYTIFLLAEDIFLLYYCFP